jgi:hypothetical protein
MKIFEKNQNSSKYTGQGLVADYQVTNYPFHLQKSEFEGELINQLKI